MIKGIDISEWQRSLKLDKAVKNGYQFAIIRIGYTGYGQSRSKNADPLFNQFYKDALNNKIKKGGYYYSCATNGEEGRKEAEFVYKLIRGLAFELPIFIDIEEQRWQANDKKGVTDAAVEFCEYLKAKGYNTGVYASESWWNTKLEKERLNKYCKWVACWGRTPTIPYDIWQDSSERYIGSIRVDTNILKEENIKESTEEAQSKSKDIIVNEVINGKWGNGIVRETLLKKAGYNYDEIQNLVNIKLSQNKIIIPPIIPQKKTDEQIADEVIRGKWGNGNERKKRLTNAGYNYYTIQKIVNQKMAK